MNDEIVDHNSKVEFKDWWQLEEYIANTVAEFVRDNMLQLNNHPIDYQDHYDYIYELYMQWLQDVPE